MTKDITIWHNPRCSKSRAALAILEASGRPLRVVHYLDTPPDRAALAAVADAIPEGAAGLLRPGEDEAKTRGLSASSARDTILDALVEAPRLIQRPVVLEGSRALVARPPELLEDWLGAQGE